MLRHLSEITATDECHSFEGRENLLSVKLVYRSVHICMTDETFQSKIISNPNTIIS